MFPGRSDARLELIFTLCITWDLIENNHWLEQSLIAPASCNTIFIIINQLLNYQRITGLVKTFYCLQLSLFFPIKFSLRIDMTHWCGSVDSDHCIALLIQLIVLYYTINKTPSVDTDRFSSFSSQLKATGKIMLKLLTCFTWHSSRWSKLKGPPSTNIFRNQGHGSFRPFIRGLNNDGVARGQSGGGIEAARVHWILHCLHRSVITRVRSHWLLPSLTSPLLVAVAVSVCGAGLVYPGSPGPAQTVQICAFS